MSEQLVRQAVDNHPQLSANERQAIKLALDMGARYGYGNVIAWLATEWAVMLRDKSGMSEAGAIAAVNCRGPYTLPRRTGEKEDK